MSTDMPSGVKRQARRLVAISAATMVLGGGAILINGVSANASSGRVTATTAVNVRSGPGTSYALLGGLYPGITVLVRGPEKNGWTPVSFNGHDAWISSKYLHQVGTGVSAPVSSPANAASKQTTTDVNVRSGPGSSYGVVTSLPPNTIVQTTGRSKSGFTEVIYLGVARWISSPYLGAVNQKAKVTDQKSAIATAVLDVRSVSGAAYTKLGEIPAGGKVMLTGGSANGRSGIYWGNGTAWVTTKYLSTSAVSTASQKPITGPAKAPAKAPAKPSTPVKKPTPAKKPSAPAKKPTPAKKPSAPAKKPTPPKKTASSKPVLPKVVGTRYATTELILRSNPNSDYKDYGDVATGTKLSITGTTRNGRAEIVYNGAVRWVTAQYLAASKPKPKPTTISTPVGVGSVSNPAQVASKAVAFAKSQLGLPYSYGGGSLTGPSNGIAQGSGTYGFDCSGLVRAAYYVASNGKITLPRTTYDQINRGTAIGASSLRPGDLVFFNFGSGEGWSHVGIYIGNGQMIDAPHTGANVRYDNLHDSYWSGVQKAYRRLA